MNNRLNIYSIANCGLLIKSPQTSILIDGIYQFPDMLFSKIPGTLMEQIISGQKLFNNINGLLFTHSHEDHFDSQKARECLEHNSSVKNIFLPKDKTLQIQNLQEYAVEAGIKCINMDLHLGECADYTIKDLKIKYFRTIHSGKEFSHVQHYCFLIAYNGKTIYISGDADFFSDYQHQMLSGENISLAFFNPLYFYHHQGRYLIKALQPEKIIMYHVPFAKDDTNAFRKNSERILAKFADTLPPCEIVSHELQLFNI